MTQAGAHMAEKIQKQREMGQEVLLGMNSDHVGFQVLI